LLSPRLREEQQVSQTPVDCGTHALSRAGIAKANKISDFGHVLDGAA
jgi:hypothetical protein